MKTLSASLSHLALPLDRALAATDGDSATRTSPSPDRARVRSGAQASLLAALGSLSALLTLVYMLTDRSPFVLLVMAPLWSLWLVSFINWARGAEAAERPLTVHLSTPGFELVRGREEAELSPCWQRVVRSRAALARDSGRPEETSGSG